MNLTASPTREQRHTDVPPGNATPYAPTCTYDSGSGTDCQPLCSAVATQRVSHLMPCYGWFHDDVCARHVLATLGRVYPDRNVTTPIPRGPRAVR